MKNFRAILKKDRALRDEVEGLITSGRNLPVARRYGIDPETMTKAMIGPRNESPLPEAMVMAMAEIHLRPALLVRNNRIEHPESAELRKRWMPYFPKLESRIPSVGRIELLNLGRLPFEGTCWMVSDNVLVTNRHVARRLAEKKGRTITFLKNAVGDEVAAVVDFKEEHVGKNIARPEFELAIEKVLFMTDASEKFPDIAFMVVQKHPKCPPPIPISVSPVTEGQYVSVVGYPADDPNGILSRAAANEVFGGIYDVKRCSPGEVDKSPGDAWYFLHDCTTLGGCSGSVVLDNQTGNAVGLHFMGETGKENYAVRSVEIVKYLKKINTKVYLRSAPSKDEERRKERGPSPEAPPESFDGKGGYQSDFLGKKFSAPLPTIVKGKKKIATFTLKGQPQSILNYEHFSVVMNKERRLCFFSACNIDGSLSKRGVKRSAWKFDPRLPMELQIKDECYGNPPKFSRGHMTRKEDPIWGSVSIARAACADTFHVTNAVPQMQPFNAPIWLALEDYALENARQDEMKISVFTGPFFGDNDPVRDGVKIPLEFYKVIAFIHDDTGKLCATGYTVSQSDSFSGEEFVYGEFRTYQVSIKSIETRAGISFGKLSKVDPIRGEEAIATALASADDIRFV